MGNFWYDVPVGTELVASIGGGLGTARIGAEINSIAGAAVTFDEDDWVFAYQLRAGIDYRINANETVTLDDRFFGTTDTEFETGGVIDEAEYHNHSIMAGVRYRILDNSASVAVDSSWAPGLAAECLVR